MNDYCQGNLDKPAPPIHGLWEPLVTVTFIRWNTVFVSVYQRLTRVQYHFNYNFKSKVATNVGSIKLEDCSQRNFPLKSFYSKEHGYSYTFYR